MVMINAWNEWFEGAAIEPDTYWGMAYLEQIREVFGVDAAPTEDEDGKPRKNGNGRPAERETPVTRRCWHDWRPADDDGTGQWRDRQ